MRYLIQFADRSSLIVSQKEGEAVGNSLVKGNAVVLRGSFIRPNFISIVKPIQKGWFTKDFIDDQQRSELAHPDNITFLPPPTDA